MKITPAAIVEYAKLYRGKKDERIYEYLKSQLRKFVLPEGRLEQIEKEIRGILGL